jgi:hypothetical protein
MHYNVSSLWCRENEKISKSDVNYIILMKRLAEKHDDWNEKNAIFNRETDIIFYVSSNSCMNSRGVIGPYHFRERELARHFKFI